MQHSPFQIFFKVALPLLFICLVFMPFDSSCAPLSANVAAVDLTPPLEMKFALGGYGARMSQPATGVHDRIWVKALVISDGSKKYALVTMDVLGLPANVKPQVLDKIGDASWSPDNVMLLPSHTHASLDMTALNDKNILNSPQIGIFQKELLDFVVEKTAMAIKQASMNLQPARIGTGAALIKNMNRNRRNDAASDPELTLLRVDKLDGAPLAVLVNWTAHPTMMGENDMLVSGGWPGYLQREMEDWIGDGVVALYYNGAQGDQTAVRPAGGSHYEQAEFYGRRMAKHAFKLFGEIVTAKNVAFDYNYQIAELPERRAHPLFKETGGEEYAIDDQTMKLILDVFSPPSVGISAVRIGDFMIVGAPGELACQLGLDIKSKLKNAGLKYPTIGGLANEWISYIMSTEQYENAGYETSVSFYGPELGNYVVEAMLKTATPIFKN
jgi:neutral ceramidase